MPESTGVHEADSSRSSRDWLLEQYWRSAFAILVAAAPVLLFLGEPADAWGVGGYVVVTVAAWLVAKRSALWGARLHLLAMLPYWTWYSALEGGVPMRLGAGVAEWAVLLVFPLITLVTIEGARGAGTGAVVGGALLAWRWPASSQLLVGAFLLSMALLIGLVFRRLATSLDTAHARVRHMAFHDALTDLPNRRELHARAGRVLIDGAEAALLFIDLNRFKTVNDALGHRVGDQLLQVIATRLRETIPSHQLVARIGGDEFAMLLSGVGELAARDLAKEVIQRVREPVDVAGRVLHVSGSVGIAVFPEHGKDVDALMQAADVAMYYAKTIESRVAVSGEDGDDGPQSRFELEVDLWEAVKRDELVLQYQPVLALGSGEVVGAEALVRWQHPDVGMVPPGDFISLAEESGAIVDIDCWVAEQALDQLAAWRNRDFDGTVSVNASARTLLANSESSGDSRYLQTLRDALDASGVPPSQVIVEITESAAMSDPAEMKERLDALAELGLGVALDDFGMGYSSLAYLKELPATRLKIDRAFVRGIGHHPRDEQLVELVLKIAQSFELDVVAEGVEFASQMTWLSLRGCQHVQGFHIGRPGSADAVLRLAKSGIHTSGAPGTAEQTREAS
jgi:diguanylate cyclase